MHAARQFDRATVHDFLPILIERRVCAELDRVGDTGEGRHEVA